jgi:uncharacterized protein YrzB (UPF0473 family)
MTFDDRNIIELIDEDGNKEEFEVLATFHVEENEYAVLVPNKEGEEEFYVLRIEYDEEGNMILVSIDDKEELDDVIAAYEAIVDELL